MNGEEKRKKKKKKKRRRRRRRREWKRMWVFCILPGKPGTRVISLEQYGV
jgi:hypothetical protein